MSSSELTDIEACDNIIKEVRDYIGNADKLMDSEFYESVKQVDEGAKEVEIDAELAKINKEISEAIKNEQAIQ